EATVSYYYKSIGKQKTRYTKHIEHHSFYEYLKDAGIQNIAVFSSFPSHSYNALRTLVDLGFTSKEPIQIEGASIKPLDFTMEVARRIPVPEGYTEKENLWLKVFGKKGGKDVTAEMDVVAGTLPGWEDATCNIDTGFPAAITAEMLFDGRLADRGLFSPEFIMPHEPFFSELGKRKIAIYDNGKKIN
ncbi:MAG: saccharopine dehydrogenase C-terminal domain-containing protein, partial [Patescibacteria group bacterium]